MIYRSSKRSSNAPCLMRSHSFTRHPHVLYPQGQSKTWNITQIIDILIIVAFCLTIVCLSPVIKPSVLSECLFLIVSFRNKLSVSFCLKVHCRKRWKNQNKFSDAMRRVLPSVKHEIHVRYFPTMANCVNLANNLKKILQSNASLKSIVLPSGRLKIQS